MNSRPKSTRRASLSRAVFVLSIALLIGLFSATHASAQDEVDGVKPLVMVIMDTSGSMEFVTQDDEYPCCVSTDPVSFDLFTRRCAADNRLLGNPILVGGETDRSRLANYARGLADSNNASPYDFGGGSGRTGENYPRHVVAKEVMTGRLENYACMQVPREPLIPGGGDVFDFAGRLMSDDDGTPVRFDLDDGHPVPRYQTIASERINSTGIVFLNRDLVRFGAMTLDSDPWGQDGWGLTSPGETQTAVCANVVGEPAPILPPNTCTPTPGGDGIFDVNSAYVNREWKNQGLYGSVGAGRWNLGARAWYDQPRGERRPVFAGSVPFGDLNDPVAGRLAASQVEKSLSQFIPYSGTPLAAAFKDFRSYLEGNLPDRSSLPADDPRRHRDDIEEDVFKDCRQKHAIVITDGDPSYDYCHNPAVLNTLPQSDQDMCESYRGTYKSTIEELSDLVQSDPNLVVHIVGFHPPRGCLPNDPNCVNPCLANDPNCADPAIPCVGADNVDGTNVASDCIDQLAFVGGSDSDNDGTNRIYAYRATNQEQLSREITRILNSIVSKISSRTKIATTTRTRNRLTKSELYQFGSAFELNEDTHLWRGVLERQTFSCQGNNEVVVTEDFSDYFDDNPGILDDRKIFTAFQKDSPINTPILDTYQEANNSRLIRLENNSSAMASRLPNMDNNDVDAAFSSGVIPGLNYSDGPINSEDSIRNLLFGTHPFREGRVLGDIFHSNPTVVGGPELDVPIRGYERFSKTISPPNNPRPTMLYVGTNAGLLHAFNAEFDFTQDVDTRINLDAGGGGNQRQFNNTFESWAFLPEALQDKVYLQQVTRIFGVDASPTVRDLRMFRGDIDLYPAGLIDPAADGAFGLENSLAVPDVWATVLVSGLGQGGRSYFALDVSDPTNPRHLWELNEENERRRLADTRSLIEPFQNVSSDVDYPAAINERIPFIGLTYGQAGLGTVGLRAQGGERIEKAVAILPGGLNPFPDVTDTTDPNYYIGKAIFVIDQTTGAILRRFTHAREGATVQPLTYAVTGSVASFSDFPGTFLTRSFVGDAGGRLLRIDTRASDPADWYVEVFDDAFCDGNAFSTACSNNDAANANRRPIFIKPALAPAPNGDLVIVYGTGDIDDLPRRNQTNRVISLREETILDESGNIGTNSIRPKRNWVYDFTAQNGSDGEKLTGSPLIFSNVVYFPTFVPNSGDVCAFGGGRVYALDYLGRKCEADDGSPLASCDANEDLIAGFGDEEEQDDVTVNNNQRYFDIDGAGVIFGLDLTRRPDCTNVPDNLDADGAVGDIMQGQDNLELVVQTGANSNVNGGAPGALAQSKIKKVRFKVNAPASRIFPTSWSLILD